MTDKTETILRDRLDAENFEKLMALPNPKLHRFVVEAVELGDPRQVFVVTDDAEDIALVRQLAIDLGEETPLAIDGHTVHFDGPQDQARDKANTKYLVQPGDDLGESLNQMDRAQGLAEVKALLKGAMTGKVLFVRFFCLGPTRSVFSISGVQCTDSAYVAHSEDLLYRSGYEQFKRLGDSPDFFRVLHSAGELDERNTSKNVAGRRVYIDHQDECVYSVNTQYAGNTIGFKKLALRLAIRKADREGWLAEHMFVMASYGPAGRKTYFTGAFPSACGKTSTSMIRGESIVGDDLAYLRKKDGQVRAANVESGIFGIIQNVSEEDAQSTWDPLMRPGEVIFSNVLIADGTPYWLGDGRKEPKRGVNYAGDWFPGKLDVDGEEIPVSHGNARYTIRLSAMENLDEKADDPQGVVVGGIIYGGRDSDTWVPVRQAFDWAHGVITIGASLESETTSATLGQEGVRKFQPMSNLDFVSLPLGRYIQNHLDFVSDIQQPPPIFGVNYFQRGKEQRHLTGMKDKYVWLKWMERRANGEGDYITTPIGYFPCYDELRPLFREVLDLEYTQEQYVEQFTLRVVKNLEKIDRIETIYRTQVPDTPAVFFDTLAAQRERLIAAQAEHGDHISPLTLAG